MNNEFLTVKNLKTYFLVNKKKQLYVRAVDGVSFTINNGEIMGLVGESGSGKSTIAHTIMGMATPNDGEILLDGKNIVKKDNRRDFYFKQRVQLIFQDAGSSLNPCHDVHQVLSLPLKIHKIVPTNQIEKKMVDILECVELPNSFIHASTSSIGGGEKQLVAIARALCSNPDFIILDEPTSSLDVSIQAKIINMLLKIHKERKLTYLIITHDLSLMRNIAMKVAIMYLGRIVETSYTKELYKNPLHPYSQMLFSSIPVISNDEEKLKPKKVVSRGEIPSPVNMPSGCKFKTRCNSRLNICDLNEPELVEVSPNHFVRCHLFN